MAWTWRHTQDEWKMFHEPNIVHCTYNVHRTHSAHDLKWVFVIRKCGKTHFVKKLLVQFTLSAQFCFCCIVSHFFGNHSIHSHFFHLDEYQSHAWTWKIMTSNKSIDLKEAGFDRSRQVLNIFQVAPHSHPYRVVQIFSMRISNQENAVYQNVIFGCMNLCAGVQILEFKQWICTDNAVKVRDKDLMHWICNRFNIDWIVQHKTILGYFLFHNFHPPSDIRTIYVHLFSFNPEWNMRPIKFNFDFFFWIISNKQQFFSHS